MYFFYYFPIGLDVAVRRKPIVTYFILASCVILFLIYKYRPFGSWWDLSLLIFQPSSPTLATAITHAFLHGGWFHLIGNLVYIMVFGPSLEDRLGSAKFYTVFAVTAAAGVYTHVALVSQYAPQYLRYGIVGASGATSGILGAFLVRLYYARVRVAYWIFMPLQGVNRAGRTYVPVVFAVIFWFMLQAINTIMQFGTAGVRVAYSVHIGGFAAGILLALCFKGLPAARAEGHLSAARRRFEQADWFGAQAEYIEYLAREPRDADAHAGLARAYLAGSDAAHAREHLVEAARIALDRGDRDAAETYFEEGMRHIVNFALPEPLHIDLACGLERTLKYRSAMHAYENFVWLYPLSAEAPFVLLRMALILERRLGSPREALACYMRLVQEYATDRWAGHARMEMERLELAGAGGGAGVKK
jgi:membrane associated rhomboid family serine protease